MMTLYLTLYLIWDSIHGFINQYTRDGEEGVDCWHLAIDTWLFLQDLAREGVP